MLRRCRHVAIPSKMGATTAHEVRPLVDHTAVQTQVVPDVPHEAFLPIIEDRDRTRSRVGGLTLMFQPAPLPRRWSMPVLRRERSTESSDAVRPASRLLSARAAIEFGTLVGLAVIYNFVRAGGGPSSKHAAMAHAHDIVRLEGWMFDKVELGLNHWISGITVLAVAACYFYALMHYVMTPVVLLLSRKRGGWKYWRGYWALVLACAFALVSYANFPVAPPRLVPDIDAIDVMRQFSSWGWWGSAASAPRGLGDATNQYAAMPSLHFGWSLWCGIQMWGFGPKKWKVVAIAYPAVQALVVIATANHFGLDIVGGAICVLSAFAVVTVSHNLFVRLVPAGRAVADQDELVTTNA
jgi:hypothetical protein